LFINSDDSMNFSLEERKLQYIQQIEAEYTPAEKNYWQHPPPVYSLTADYAARYDKPLITGEPLIIKKTKKEGPVVTVMVVVAALLLYMLGKKEFGFLYVAFLLFLLIVVLPLLLNNKTVMRVDREGVWTYKENKTILWKNILLPYIKQVHEEDVKQFLVVHYYDAVTDEFRSCDIELNGLVLPAFLSATIEAFRNA
jgi:hypothetical protein